MENDMMPDIDDELVDDEYGAGGGGGGGGRGRDRGDSFDASALQAMDANDFSNGRIVEELELRKIRPTGFRDQDVATLQVILNEEFQMEKENLIKQQREKKEVAAQQAGLQRKRALLEMQLQEEKDAVSADHILASWLDLVKQNATPPTARIQVNCITARCLSKAMWTNTSLTSLDLSRNGLDDFAGAYVARLLMRNKSLRKLEMEGNCLGPKTLAAFGESLKENSTLTQLTLESNPLTSKSYRAGRGGGGGGDGDGAGGASSGGNSSNSGDGSGSSKDGGSGGTGSDGRDGRDGRGSGPNGEAIGGGPMTIGKDLSGVMVLAEMLRTNTCLTSLNLWRCGLGGRGGAELARGFQSNHTITFLDVGDNGMLNDDLQAVTDKLDDNVERYKQRLEVSRAEQAAQDEIDGRERQLFNEIKKERELQAWLQDQRVMRAEARRMDVMDAFQAQVQVEEEKKRLEEERAEAERKAEEEKKNKKGKKGKKKK